MAEFINIFTEHIGNYGYLLAFVISLLENSIFLGLLVPGDTIAILAGFYAAQGAISLPLVLLLMIVGSAIGDNLGFLLGRYKGKEWLLDFGPKIGYKKEKILKTDLFWDQHGEKAIIIGDFVSYVRTFVPFFAGASKISHRRFAAWDLLAVSAHAVILALLGYFFGEYWEQIRNIFGIFGFLLFLVFLVIVYKYLTKKSGKK
jgi:membrane protein DedA with SNARE-associated domain